MLAGSIGEIAEGEERIFNTSCLIDRSGEIVAVYRKIHMFDVEVGGVRYEESAREQPGEEIVSAGVDGVELGMTICYDLRFCELYRILAVAGARIFSVPSAFTLATGRDHWDVLLRARAIENAAFVVAPNQYGETPPHYSSYGRSAIVDPWGVVLAQAPDEECFISADLDLEAQERVRESLPALANRRPEAYRWPDPVEARLMAKAPPVDRRRQILDAAIRVFAREGFNDCRVSDIAREAEVAYGLVYHYFDSKDQVLNELFVERWSLLLAAIEEVDARTIPPREKLDAVAGFIIDSYRHDPELMKVIIIEVTRAANSFTRTHLPEIRQAYALIAKIVSDAQASGEFRDRRRSRVRVDVVLRGDRAAADRLGLRDHSRRRGRLRPRARDGGGDDLQRTRECFARAERGRLVAVDNEIVKRLMWTGLVAGTGALASVVAMRASAAIWMRVFGEDPPE